MKNRPKYATEALKQCHENLFANINILITILATLPVTTATAERTPEDLSSKQNWERQIMAIHRKTLDIYEANETKGSIGTFLSTQLRANHDTARQQKQKRRGSNKTAQSRRQGILLREERIHDKSYAFRVLREKAIDVQMSAYCTHRRKLDV
ncbi:hypothetical protein PR048_017652 [Dryococelus australis]|uniref:Uncharacterized protein n=1 Tax=Dryococelus australis TaxID=614101 RepID=A0ABQ9HA69_9NEOP|nr:hypothetical protein PR048_017652 [Dryococelus australis]